MLFRLVACIFVVARVSGLEKYIPGYRVQTHRRAVSTCRKLPGELASIRNTKILESLYKQNLVPQPATNDSYLFGMFLKTQLSAEVTEWEFSDGVSMEMSEYPLWAEGFPKERAGVCARLEATVDYMVANVECFQKMHFICQMYPDKKGKCINGYYRYDKFCFNVSGTKMDFWSARSHCKKSDGYLAAIQDKETHRAALNEISLTKIGIGLWTGAKKTGSKWQFQDGTPLPTNSEVWAENEPKSGSKNKCAMLSLRTYKLMAENCELKLGYLCEQTLPGKVKAFSLLSID